MEIFIGNRNIPSQLLRVSDLNYGQMQRWENHIPHQFSIRLPLKTFIDKYSDHFEQFRCDEIADNDNTHDIPELIAFKEANWPSLTKLLNEHLAILKGLIIYDQHEVLQLITTQTGMKYCSFYSANSIDEVIFQENQIQLVGICFYVER